MSRILQLLADNRRTFTPVKSRIRAEGDEATVYLYDTIVGDRLTAEWWGGICPQDLVPELVALKVSTIHLRINSPGGDMFAGQAIAQALREHPAQIVGHVDGLAASAATHVACACDETVIAAGAMYMIHKSWSFAMGDSDDMLATAALLQKADGIQVKGYMLKTGKPEQQITDWIGAETWFTADEAVEHGFVDAIAEAAEKGATPNALTSWNLSAFSRAPKPVQTPAQPLDATAIARLVRAELDIATKSEEHRDRQARLAGARIA